MRDAMFAAPLGDDVFGDDPSVNALQERIAAMLGKEAALFMPTGTQSNLAALMGHCQRGDEYLVGQMAHTYRWEGGGAAVLGSIQPQPIAHQPDGSLALADIEAAIKPDDPHFARTRLLASRTPSAASRWRCRYLRDATALARRHGLATHLDGARVFNAAVVQAEASGSDPYAEVRAIADLFDSVSVCFSKGLGAPVGSALVGSRELVARAKRVRKMAGGGMRQAGLLAAAASLCAGAPRAAPGRRPRQRAPPRRGPGRHRRPHLRAAGQQHPVRRPRARARAGAHGGALGRRRTSRWSTQLRERGVLCTGLYKLRFVTHLDVDAAGVDRAIAEIRRAVGA